MKRKMIFLVVSDTGTILTRLIKAYTKTPYNHASISFDAELSEVYSFGRKTVYNPFIGGFVKEDIHSILLQQILERDLPASIYFSINTRFPGKMRIEPIWSTPKFVDNESANLRS